MPVLVIHPQPEMFQPEMYDAVNERIGVDSEPPAGLYAHTLARGEDGRWLIIDIWESREAHDRFGQERLSPAIEAVMRDQGMDPSEAPPAEQQFYETHSVLLPGAAAPAG